MGCLATVAPLTAVLTVPTCPTLQPSCHGKDHRSAGLTHACTHAWVLSAQPSCPILPVSPTGYILAQTYSCGQTFIQNVCNLMHTYLCSTTERPVATGLTLVVFSVAQTTSHSPLSFTNCLHFTSPYKDFDTLAVATETSCLRLLADHS